MIPPLHSWKVDKDEAIEIQNRLRSKLILKKAFSKLDTIGGADVSYSKEKDILCGAIAVFSYPELKLIDSTALRGRISFPYIPGLLAFREGPILLKAFEKLRIKPDLMIFEGHGIAHPRGFGLASHLGLWLDIPSIGCAKNPLVREFQSPTLFRGSVEWVSMGDRRVGAILRTKERVKPVFVSPGHRIDLETSIQIILAACRGYRMPEPLRKAHQLSQAVGSQTYRLK